MTIEQLPPVSEEFASTAQLARALGCGRKNVWRLIEQKKILPDARTTTPTGRSVALFRQATVQRLEEMKGEP